MSARGKMMTGGLDGAAAMAGGALLKQLMFRSFDRSGNILRRKEPTPQNRTAITEIIPKPETAPKFFDHPPTLATKSTCGASLWWIRTLEVRRSRELSSA